MITCLPTGEDIDVSRDEIVGVIRELLGAPDSACVAGIRENVVADIGGDDAVVAKPPIVDVLGVDALVIHIGGVIEDPLRDCVGFSNACGGCEADGGSCCGKGWNEGDT